MPRETEARSGKADQESGISKSIIVVIMTALAALVLGITQSLTTIITASIALTAMPVQALIVPGTGTSDPYLKKNYLSNVVNYCLVPSGDCPSAAPGQCQVTGIRYPA